MGRSDSDLTESSALWCHVTRMSRFCIFFLAIVFLVSLAVGTENEESERLGDESFSVRTAREAKTGKSKKSGKNKESKKRGMMMKKKGTRKQKEMKKKTRKQNRMKKGARKQKTKKQIGTKKG